MTEFEIASAFIDTIIDDELAYHLERSLDAGYGLAQIIQEYVAWQK